MFQTKFVLGFVGVLILAVCFSRPCSAESVPDRYKDPAERVAADPAMSAEFISHKVPPLRPLCRQDDALTVDRIYYDDGSLYLEVQCRDGKRHGRLQVFFRDGSIWEETNYGNDKREGAGVIYYATGAIRQEEHYIQDRLDGQQRKYDPEGRPVRDSFFTAGKKVSDDIGYRQLDGKNKDQTIVGQAFTAE